MKSSETALKEFIDNLDKPCVDFWREALSNLRQLHNDIWNGVRFFLTVNGIVLAGFSALLRGSQHNYVHGVMLLFLPLIGFAVTMQARSILSRHRSYYLSMLIRKTLIEKQLGFYDFSLCELPDGQHIDLSFPWHVDRKFLAEFSKDVTQWRKDQQKRPGLISTILFNIYNCVLALHIILACAIGILLYTGYFAPTFGAR